MCRPSVPRARIPIEPLQPSDSNPHSQVCPRTHPIHLTRPVIYTIADVKRWGGSGRHLGKQPKRAGSIGTVQDPGPVDRWPHGVVAQEPYELRNSVFLSAGDFIVTRQVGSGDPRPGSSAASHRYERKKRVRTMVVRVSFRVDQRTERKLPEHTFWALYRRGIGVELRPA